jgi:hypothetical protein
MSAKRFLILTAAVGALAGCMAQRPAPPPPQREQPVAPPPVARPLPPPPAASADWRDLPLSPGAWVYSSEASGSQALFGPPASEAAFIVRCERSSGRVILAREGTSRGNALTIRTSALSRSLPATARTEPLAYVSASLGARDPLLDSMAFSRGRFTVEMAGAPMLVIPAWPEPARVIEDCRS